ncbi:hypothetical protein IWQ47_002456 [Aquimarina sp. EL_43]|uniref:hypothetical protein n=1 Tax=unclassified Aquimarina TaxID=2627091 RepID=UPI0018CAFB08|nr:MULTISPECIES: hypothetical protein [unclassified Aquimarina]MBG6130986.1 hypothetical protein [Aquimarina sp. EL_35]MBG6151445.1 hypothetical protein [Aquimarina sp. EL_32]MBG6169376.1 hypothetical protein [Aquimarina sp. EL_43]
MDNLVLRALQSPFNSQTRSAEVKQFSNDIFSFFNTKTRSEKLVNHQTVLCLSAVYNAIDQMTLQNFQNLFLKNGKSAIAFDRLEFKVDQEPFRNIVPIEIKNCSLTS